jgi:hypothetical protein
MSEIHPSQAACAPHSEVTGWLPRSSTCRLSRLRYRVWAGSGPAWLSQRLANVMS